MKKLFILGVVLLMAVVFSTSVFVMAKEGKGAVRVDLTTRIPSIDGYYDAGSGDPAGWAMIDTTASGKIQIEIHMYSGIEGTYSVYARVGKVHWDPLTELTVNKNGKGNAHVELDIPEGEEGSLKVQVLVIKPEWLGEVRGYTNGFSEVPLKK